MLFPLSVSLDYQSVRDQGNGIMIIPLWPTQYWFPPILKHSIDYPILLQQSKDLLKLPFDKTRIHPLYPKPRMMAVRLSGSQLEIEKFQEKFKAPSWTQGESQHSQGMNLTCADGKHFALNGIRIPFYQLRTVFQSFCMSYTKVVVIIVHYVFLGVH